MAELREPERLEPGEELAFARAVNRHFHEDTSDEELAPYVEVVADRDGFRAWVTRGGDRIVGNLGVYVATLSLPGGGAVPVTAITAVGVSQTHRRRGILRGLITASLREAAELGEPVASLYASESAIYGRFGFGASMPSVRYKLERAHARLRDPVESGLVEAIEADDAIEQFPPVFEALRMQRAAVGRSASQWRRLFAHDPVSKRAGASRRRFVHVPGRGYATYAVKDAWEEGLPAGAVRVEELVATDPEADAALWQFVCDVDLTRVVLAGLRPPDDAVPLLLVDRLRTRAREDSPVWTCLLDVPTALTARGYGAAGAIIFTVHDVPGTSTATYRLEVAPDGAICEPTEAEPELELSGEALSAVWLGGVRTTQWLSARRLVEHRAGAAGHLDRLLAVDRAPWTPFEF